jgi:phosphohistidine swiveling domain-containing protein
MKYVHELKEYYSIHLTISGGKGANLHKLIRYGYKVPEGFIVNTKAFETFLTHNNLSSFIKSAISAVKINDSESVFEASNKIKKAIGTAIFPREIAIQIEKILFQFRYNSFSVRSSGIFEDNYKNSWAGQFDSFLQIDKKDLLNSIKDCWASFFNARAINYNVQSYKNVKNLKFAVVIQRMLNSEKSGVAFSVEPQKQDFNKILIEATSGFGENLVSGKEIPFKAILDKKTKIVLEKTVTPKTNYELLNYREISLLCEKVIKLEKQFNRPVDVEWSIENGELYFLQVRPITGLNKRNKKEDVRSGLPDINNYELTFKASGISFLFTDILVHAYKYLDPLFTSKQSEFAQYIYNHKIEYATKFGMKWLSKKDGFKDYQSKFERFYRINNELLDKIVNSKQLTKTSTKIFFQKLVTLFGYYSRMDNYFTNLAYLYSEENITLKYNLDLLSKFKDSARLWINNIAIEQDGYLSQFLRRLNSEFSIEKNNLEYYKVEEILQLFHNLYVLDRTIENRKESFIIYNSVEQISYLSGKKSLGFLNKISRRDNFISSSKLKGQVANKVQKLVKGKARVIKVDYANFDEMNRSISEMNKGEILVSEFTAPELISACRKAKAIVTDIGGMLSHAAIVSRELNIPCLVGTVNASKMIQTGDEIRIDFDLGIVEKTS